MIHHWEPNPYPVEFHIGDIVFATGRPPSTTQPVWEHVALVAEAKTVTSDNDLLDLPVFGMPESRNPFSPGLIQASARYLLNSNNIWWKTIGSVACLWNMVARARLLSPSTEQRLLDNLAIQEAKTFEYGDFDNDAFAAREVRTNCLGFVCSTLGLLNIPILAGTYPTYPGPYMTDQGKDRNFPSPGHLARAMKLGDGNYPYKPADSAEASQYSRASRTLEDVLNGVSP